MNNNSTITSCGRCKSGIKCLSENILLCECSKVVINNETSTFLKRTNYDCLCNSCLLEVNEIIQKSNLFSFPKSRSEMIEGTHYYIENGFLVFTELYHVLRGKCCQSGCRHCAYGFKN